MLRIITACLLIILCGFTQFCTAQQGELTGKITDGDTGEGLPFASVYVVVDDLPRGMQTDFDGFYSIKPIPAGIYVITIKYEGYNTQVIEGVNLPLDQISFVDAKLNKSQDNFLKIDSLEYSELVIPTGNKTTVTAKDIANFPIRKERVYQEDEGSDLRTCNRYKRKFVFRIKRLFRRKTRNQ